MAIEHHTLPPDFLQGKSPDISLAPIDFTSTPLAQYKDHYAVVLDGVLSKEECGALLAAAEAQTGGVWEQAMINGGGNKQTLSLEARDCGRIIWDSPEVVQLIWNRIRDHVPELDVLEKRPLVTGTTTKVKRWKVSRLNERMRFLKYGGGQYFRRRLKLPRPPRPQLTSVSSLRRPLYRAKLREVVLHAALIPERFNIGFRRRQTPGRSNEVLFVHHEREIGRGTKNWQDTALPAKEPAAFRRRSRERCQVHNEDGSYV